MSHESANSASSTGSGGYMGAFSTLGSGRGSGGGPFLSFRGFGSSREKKTPLPRDDLDDAPAPPSPEQISYQAVATTGQPEIADTAPILAPPGAPLEGRWVEERYCGLTTWVITLLTGCVCSYFCPCDRRTVWISKSIKYNERGAVTDDYIFLNPFPPGCCCHPRPNDQHVVVI